MNVAIVSAIPLDTGSPSSLFLKQIIDTLTEQSIQVSLVTAKQLTSNKSQTGCVQRHLSDLFEQTGIDRLYLAGDKPITQKARKWCQKMRIQHVDLNLSNYAQAKPAMSSYKLAEAIKFVYAALQVLAALLFNVGRSNAKVLEQPLSVWVYNDAKPGHTNQLRGLLQELKKHVLINVKWIDVNRQNLSLFDTVKKLKQHGNKVDIVLGAGHKTHIPMLLARLFTRSKSIVLMKPGLPINWFDLALIPEHDKVRDKSNVITTTGVLNTIKPSLKKDPTKGLILLGGPSKHFNWDDASLIEQISHITESQPQISWELTTSRRTPESFIRLLQASSAKISFIGHDKTHPKWVAEKLALASQTWVSEDSTSMIFEALSSGTKVGALELTSLKKGRLQRCIKQLIDDKKVVSFSQWQQSPVFPLNANQLHEAARCANLMLDYIIDDRQSADHYPSTA